MYANFDRTQKAYMDGLTQPKEGFGGAKGGKTWGPSPTGGGGHVTQVLSGLSVGASTAYT